MLFACLVVICIFVLRDVFLLGVASQRGYRKLLIYAVVSSSYLTTAVIAAYAFSFSAIIHSLRLPSVCAAIIAFHIVLWRTAVWFKNQPVHDGMWLIALTPAPMLIFSLLVTSYVLAEQSGSDKTVTWSAFFAAGWILFVCAGAAAFRFAYRGWQDHTFVADLAAAASWTGLMIVPLARLT
jgi:hypothetical protein